MYRVEIFPIYNVYSSLQKVKIKLNFKNIWCFIEKIEYLRIIFTHSPKYDFFKKVLLFVDNEIITIWVRSGTIQNNYMY